MADETQDETQVAEFDYRAAVLAPFAPGTFDGAPADAAKATMFDRAGVPRDHSLRVSLTSHTALNDDAKGIRRMPNNADAAIPSPVPKRLGDWLKWVDDVAAVPKAADPKPDADPTTPA